MVYLELEGAKLPLSGSLAPSGTLRKLSELLCQLTLSLRSGRLSLPV